MDLMIIVLLLILSLLSYEKAYEKLRKVKAIDSARKVEIREK